MTERVVAIIPALNEAETIAEIVTGVAPHAGQVIVVDNGSSDDTAPCATRAGATVVLEPERGYGAACLAGIASARELDPTAAIFLDGDGSEDPEQAPLLLRPILSNEADLALGIRTPASIEPGSMTTPQRIGNWLAPALIRWAIGAPYVDMPPFKAIRWNSLEKLRLTDRGYGFTVQLLIRAYQERLRVAEAVVKCRARRGGESKVSGTFSGSIRAAGKILFTVGRYGLQARVTRRSAPPS